MNTAVINVKTDPKVKASAQKVARELGMNLSTIINAYLRQLVRTKTVVFSTEKREPTEYLMKIVKEAREEAKAGRISPPFTEADKAIDWLNDPTARYQNGDKV